MSFHWFLRWFREYRELRAQLLAVTGAKIAGEDVVRSLSAEVGQLRSQVADAQRETIHSVKSVANWISQQTYGQAIYKDGVTLPAESQEAQIVNPSSNARRMCEQMEREFLDTYETG